VEWISFKIITVPYPKQSSAKYCILPAVFFLCFPPKMHTSLLYFISRAHAS